MTAASARNPSNGRKRSILNILVWAAIIVAVAVVLMKFVDIPARNFLEAHSPHGGFKATFTFFNAYVLPVPIILLIWTCLISGPKSEKWRLILQVILGLLLVWIPVLLSKSLIPRFRPNAFKGTDWWESFVTQNSDLAHKYALQSFPSGDTAVAFVLSTILAFHFPRHRIIFFVLALGCAASRYVLNAHWLSDILAGAILGYLVGKIILLLTGDVRTAK